MTNLNELTPKDLEILYNKVQRMRKSVIKLVDKYGYSASQLVSRTFENEVASVFGKKILKERK